MKRADAPKAPPVQVGLQAIGNPVLRTDEGKFVARPDGRRQTGAVQPGRNGRVMSKAHKTVEARDLPQAGRPGNGVADHVRSLPIRFHSPGVFDPGKAVNGRLSHSVNPLRR